MRYYPNYAPFNFDDNGNYKMYTVGIWSYHIYRELYPSIYVYI